MDMEMEIPSSVHAEAARSRFRDYLLALEEERRKIHVFQRELPLCLDLVTQTIEGMRNQMDGVLVASEETVTDHAPVLEEFIPLKPSLSLCSSDEEESTHAARAPPVENVAKKDEADTRPPTPETKRPMPDWLQSVQLWSQQPQQLSHTKEMPCKPVALNATKTGGAFHPFEKSKRTEPEVPASSTTAPAISAVVGDSGDKPNSDDSDEKEEDRKDVKDMETEEKDKDKEGQSQHNRKPRRCWAPDLHRKFLHALQQLGGPHVATPKQIRELMKVDGLTNDEVKSHLQKYRLHTSRRPTSTAQSGAAAAAQPPQQFVVVGSCIWVPQQEYAAAAAAAAAAQPQMKPANVASGTPSQVYAPVATLPSGLQPHSDKQTEDRRSGSTDEDSSDSPAASSSSQTTSA
ncbi:hypothetical protein QYE76_022218 [Lolium multiflorum]|uniref:HTH myb-type domain-containing protein n=1 Tax=Lolium multiflorum TaxID=4521 RepID=A0AAD8VT00_LOLMU|nr:hypothetical protein QYE76_022218 [Lolium multiflorum]